MNEQEILSKKNVVACGYGNKWVDGKDTGEPAFLVLVSNKKDKSELSENDLIPKHYNGITTDVVGNCGEIKSLSRARVRPVRPGHSCGHLWVGAGTIGGIFEDREGSIVALSNNHVLAASNTGVRGHVSLQPGVADNSNWRNNIFGSLKYYRPFAGSGQLSFDAVKWKTIVGYNVEDSAIAELSNPNDVDLSYPNIGFINGFANASVNQQVQKHGRTTLHTSGSVISVNSTVNVNINGTIYQFKEQIITTNMGSPGDSGSAIFDYNNNIIGLLFAGSDSITVSNMIQHPVATYGLKIIQTTKISESYDFNIIVDGNQTSHNHTKDQLYKAIDDARQSSREGKVVEINYKFNSSPEN